jgi:hypothetical protein
MHSGNADDAGEGVHGDTTSTRSAAVAGIALNTASSTNTAVYGEHKGLGMGVLGIARRSGQGVFGYSELGEGVHGDTNSPNFNGVAGIAKNKTGTGAGVYGESLGRGPAGLFKGNVTVTGNVTVGGDIFLTGPGADCAEHFDAAEAEQIEPGTVVVIDRQGALRPSREAYDKKVAGVVSGAGQHRPAIVLDRQPLRNGRVPVALVGKVYCKVDARYSPIDVGDLLTTSPTAGHAMRVDNPSRAFGTVIGKALQPLVAGQALIPILISLQ